MTIRLTITLLLTLALPIKADISTDMNRFFQDLGYGSSTTATGAYKGQSAGYYTGGSLFLRSGSRSDLYASVQLPRRRAGCGAIDIFTGSFSHIRSQELIASLKNIANNVPAFAFQIAMDTISPMTEKHMNKLRELADKINTFNINSCEQSAALVGSVWPKTEAAQKNVCQYIGTARGIFADAARARQACGSGGEFAKTLAKGKDDPEFKNLILDEGNLAWKAIHQNPLLRSDSQTAELLMSLAGSIIIRKTANSDDAPHVFVPLHSLAANDDVIKALLDGGRASIYDCDKTGANECLNPKLKPVTIPANKAFKDRVRKLLSSIQDKIRQDRPLDSQERALLESTRLPIYKILNVNTAYAKGSEVLGVESYADVIAADIVYQYLITGIEEILKGSQSLLLPQDLLENFREGISGARNKVIEKRNQTKDKVFTTLKLIQAAQVLERQLAGVLSADMSNTLKWAKGLR